MGPPAPELRSGECKSWRSVRVVCHQAASWTLTNMYSSVRDKHFNCQPDMGEQGLVSTLSLSSHRICPRMIHLSSEIPTTAIRPSSRCNPRSRGPEIKSLIYFIQALVKQMKWHLSSFNSFYSDLTNIFTAGTWQHFNIYVLTRNYPTIQHNKSKNFPPHFSLLILE